MTTTAELLRRVDRAQTGLESTHAGTLVAAPGADLRYLCGLDAHASERLTVLVVPSSADPVLVVPELERAGVLTSPVGELGIDIRAWAETDDPYAIVTDIAAGSTMAVSGRMWAQHVFGLLAAGGQVTSGDELMTSLRAVKSPEEIRSLRGAAHAIDTVHDAMATWLRPGRSEAEVAADLDQAIRASGHATVDFVIVGSGPNGALPHHDASARVIQPGDLVVVDIGGTMPDGYCSDSTRTYLAGGAPSHEMSTMYALLARAQQAARDAVRPGVPAQDVDAAARDVIDAGGYGPQFMHRAGHGIGLETHEPPYIVAGNAHPLRVGAAFSVEPGIYLNGRFGARIEDIVVVTDAGVDTLNETTRELRVVG